MTLTEYEDGLPVAVAYPPLVVTSLAEVVSGLGWRQFHVAETEKYAHVTYFFNGGVEQAWPGEERMLVPSPKVATYDLQPEMSAAGVTDALVAAIGSGQYDLIVANFANPDMVGHTGVWDATVTRLHVPRRLPRPRRGRGAGRRRGLPGGGRQRRPAGHHRRPRQRRRHDGRQGSAGHEALAEPGAVPAGGLARDGPGAVRRRARGRDADAHGAGRGEPAPGMSGHSLLKG